MRLRKFFLTLGVMVLASISTWAEYSPLSSEVDGDGLPVAQMGARERGMGEAGMAAIATKGYYLPNVSRSAYFDHTLFIATIEGDEDWLHDNNSANHMSTVGVPTLATFIKTSKLGVFGAYYQEAYQRKFSVLNTTDSISQGYTAEGGQYLLGVSWAYSPIPLFALGFSQNVVLSHDRFIESGVFTNNLEGINSINLDDTIETSGWGTYPTFSGTLHTSKFDAALSYTPAIHLDVTQDRRTTVVVSDSLPDTSRALPMKLAAGIAWRPVTHQTLALDLYYEDWKDNGSGVLNPAYKVGLGYELRGADNPFEEFHKRISYRAGLGYDELYLRKVPEVYGTLGLGLPLGRRGHVMDVSLKYGHRSYDGDTFFAEDYVKFSVSIIGVGTWGQPARQRH